MKHSARSGISSDISGGKYSTPHLAKYLLIHFVIRTNLFYCLKRYNLKVWQIYLTNWTNTLQWNTQHEAACQVTFLAKSVQHSSRLSVRWRNYSKTNSLIIVATRKSHDDITSTHPHHHQKKRIFHKHNFLYGDKFFLWILAGCTGVLQLIVGV